MAVLSTTAVAGGWGKAHAAGTSPVSEYYGSCPDLPAIAGAGSPVSVSPGPAEENWPVPTPTNIGTSGYGASTSGIHVDGPSLAMAAYQRVTDDGNTALQTCSINGDFTNTLTVGAGTSGLAVGDPVDVVITTRLDGTLGYVAQSGGAFTGDSNATVKFDVTDPSNYGHSVASYTADGYVEADAAVGDLTTGAGGFVEEMYKTDLYLRSNAAAPVSETPPETYNRPLNAWPNGTGAGRTPVDFGTSIGTRTIVFATTVGATLDIDGSLTTQEDASDGVVASTADLSQGFAATFAADAANPGLALTLATDAPTTQPTFLYTAGIGASYVYGETVRIPLRVAAAGGTPTGSVTATDSGTTLDTASLDSAGNATVALAGLSVGSHAITLSYGGAPGFAPTAVTVTVAVVKAPTVTTIYVSPTHPKPDQQVRLAGVVTAAWSGNGSPTGVVTFSDGSALLGTAPLVSGEAVLWVSGKHLTGKPTITATYTGDATHLTSSASFTTPKGQ